MRNEVITALLLLVFSKSCHLDREYLGSEARASEPQVESTEATNPLILVGSGAYAGGHPEDPVLQPSGLL